MLALQEKVRRTLRHEFAAFFTTMLTADDKSWPSINDQELVEALADALIQMGARRDNGVAMVQTLVYELQERVDRHLR